jgi:hypothetical protein
VVLLVTMKESRTRVVGGKLDFHLGFRIDQHYIFNDAVGFRLTGQLTEFQALPVKMKLRRKWFMKPILKPKLNPLRPLGKR